MRHGGPANIDERSPALDNVSVRDAREFLNLNVERPRMHLLDEPTGYISAMGKANLSHQIRYSVERLEAELAESDEPRVLQLVCMGDEREPRSWTLYADGLKCAHGTGEFARMGAPANPMDIPTPHRRQMPREVLGWLLRKHTNDSGLESTLFVFSQCFIIVVDEKFQQIPLF